MFSNSHLENCIKMNYFSLKHLCLSVCNDRSPFEQRLPSPAPTMGLESGCNQSCCTRNGAASESACSCLSTAENSVAGTACQRPPGSEDKRTEVLKPSSQPQAPWLTGTPAAPASSAGAMMALRPSPSSLLERHNGLFFL